MKLFQRFQGSLFTRHLRLKLRQDDDNSQNKPEGLHDPHNDKGVCPDRMDQKTDESGQKAHGKASIKWFERLPEIMILTRQIITVYLSRNML